MICKCCKKYFVKERKFHELLVRQKIYFCSNCLNNFKLEINYETIPLDDGNKLYVIHLYKNIKEEYIDYLIFEYSIVLKKLKREIKEFILIDNFNILEIDIYNILAKLNNNDLYLVSFR